MDADAVHREFKEFMIYATFSQSAFGFDSNTTSS